MIRSLYMSHISPYPTLGGERIRAAGLIELLSELGPVQAIIQSQESSVSFPQFSHPVTFAPFDFLSTMKPVVRYYQQHPRLLEHLAKILEHNPIDIAVLDYQFYGHYISWFQKQGIPVIYGTHNAEAIMALEEKRHCHGWKAFEKQVLYWLQRCHEKRYFPQADRLMVVSDEDAAYYQQWVPAQKILKIPNFLSPSRYPAIKASFNTNPKKLVMMANFTVFQNQQGAAWFLEKVWQSQKLFEEYHLLLVGKGSDTFLQQFSKMPEVAATGTVETVADFILDAWATVVPILDGSGTRLKILEAFWHQLPVITTSLGVQGIEGISGKHFLLANNPENFSKQLKYLQQPEARHQLIQQASQLLHERYTLAANLPIFQSAVHSNSALNKNTA